MGDQVPATPISHNISKDGSEETEVGGDTFKNYFRNRKISWEADAHVLVRVLVGV